VVAAAFQRDLRHGRGANEQLAVLVSRVEREMEATRSQCNAALSKRAKLEMTIAGSFFINSPPPK
jgi:hypothetical protein